MAFGWRKNKAVTSTGQAEAPADEHAANADPSDVAAADEQGELAQIRTTATQDIVYPTGLRLILLMGSVYISLFLVSLDRLIISTAIPQITNDFNSIQDIGWYGSAYLLANACFQLLYGKLYSFFSIKFVFITSILIFEAGSALCGAAPTSVAFIVGRAIAGLGSAGIFSGIIVILVYAVPLHKRPLFQGLFGAIFGISSIVGPTIGGAFTSNVTWRWCFYINLPVGGIAVAFVAFLLKIPDREETHMPLRAKLAQLDFLGTSALVPGITCVLLALQWGGTTYPWNNGRIIALLVIGAALVVVFALVQVLKPDTATVPPRIFMQRSILAGFWATFCIGSQMMVFVYFLPIWFQAIKGEAAVDSGVKLLPMLLPMVAASILTGALISRVGYYTPFMIFGVCFMCVGAGLLTTLEVDTADAKWIGYQVLYGFGMGCTFQAPNLAAQTVLPSKDVSIGASLVFFSQLFGGAIFISVGQNVLDNQLASRLSAIPGVDPSLILRTGATTLIQKLPESVRPAVLIAYNDALRNVFQVGLVLTCLTIIGALALEWRSVRKNVPKPAGPDGEEASKVGKGAGEKTPEGDTARTSSVDATAAGAL